MRRALVLLIALLFPLVLLPGTASADAPTGPAQAWHGSFPEPGEPLGEIACQLSEDPEDVVLFSETADFHGKDLTFSVADGTGQAFLAKNNWWFRAQHVNLDNGTSFTVQGRGVFRELSGELVGTWDGETWTPPEGWVWPTDEEGEPVEILGPVYRFTAVEIAHMTVRDERGRLVHNASGRMLTVAEFDTFGDGEPGAMWLRDVQEPQVLSGTFPFFDFCEMALAATT